MSTGLFKAYLGVEKNSVTRKENDFYPTPPIATYTLLRELNLPKETIIVEPCAGEGWISKECMANGYDVISSDLHSYKTLDKIDVKYGIDFLELPKIPEASVLITNPPYARKMPISMVKKALEDGYDIVAFYLRITFLEGITRHNFMRNSGLSEIYTFSDRINNSGKFKHDLINKQIGGMIFYAWFVWRKNHIGPIILKPVLAREHMNEWIQNNFLYYEEPILNGIKS